MINSELGHVKTLEEFHTSIREQQCEAHGTHYCDMHDAIRKYFKEGSCQVYMELGTHQGGTAANAMLMNPETVVLVDISMQKYNKFLRPIATEYCKKNNIDLKIKEVDSTSLASMHYCDMLMIDSVHKYHHIKKELEIHGGHVTKYIVAHDTNTIPELHRALYEFCDENSQWKIVEYFQKDAGYTVLKKS